MQKISFNKDWLFTQEGTEKKELVTLPHDAMINTARDAQMRNYFLLVGFHGGKYVYTKTFLALRDYSGKTVVLEFEGVYCMSSVYVNGTLVKEKAYGYTPFHVEISKYLKIGGENEIRVIADVPYEGHNRWYTGGGIYQPVSLYVAGPDHIELYGVRATTVSINPAQVKLETSVAGEGEVTIEIYDGDHKAAEGRGKEVLLDIQDAKLWSAHDPNLYMAVVKLWKDDELVDQVQERFGIRMVSCNPEEGLLVNGEAVFLKGGCIHNDNGVIGAVNNDGTELHRAKKIKESGFNAIRSAHHPMSRSLMKACDEVGLYVMNETFDYWYRLKGRNPYAGLFMEKFREDTAAMVLDSYNHPSVIMYSIGNEIPEAGSLKGVRIGKAIVDTIHAYDTSRLTLLSPCMRWLREYLEEVPYLTVDEDEWMAQDPANVEADRKNYTKIFMMTTDNPPDNEKGFRYPPTHVCKDEEATANLYPYLDVVGYNYYEDRYEKLHELHPERVLLGTETRAEGIVDTMRFAREHAYLIGDFIWTLQDHLGEANVCGIHYAEADESIGAQLKSYPWLVNYGGVIDLIGTILPSVYRFKLAWGDYHGIHIASQPPVHKGREPIIGSYKWTDTVDGWTYEGYEGEGTFLDVYTDAVEAEVFINGKSIGRRGVEDYFVKFPCTYEPGEVVAVGYDEAGEEQYRTSMRTAGEETRITPVADREELAAGEADFCFINVDITDGEGNLKLLPERTVNIRVEGAGTLEGFGSAYHMNEERYNQDHHTTYLGKLQAVIRSGREAGEIRVIFSSAGLDEQVVHIRNVDGC